MTDSVSVERGVQCWRPPARGKLLQAVIIKCNEMLERKISPGKSNHTVVQDSKAAWSPCLLLPVAVSDILAFRQCCLETKETIVSLAAISAGKGSLAQQHQSSLVPVCLGQRKVSKAFYPLSLLTLELVLRTFHLITVHITDNSFMYLTSLFMTRYFSYLKGIHSYV